ncbi:MAG: hypothetical protein WDW38_009665 [Sanguina aurantia]
MKQHKQQLRDQGGAQALQSRLSQPHPHPQAQQQQAAGTSAAAGKRPLKRTRAIPLQPPNGPASAPGSGRQSPDDADEDGPDDDGDGDAGPFARHCRGVPTMCTRPLKGAAAKAAKPPPPVLHPQAVAAQDLLQQMSSSLGYVKPKVKGLAADGPAGVAAKGCGRRWSERMHGLLKLFDATLDKL